MEASPAVGTSGFFRILQQPKQRISFGSYDLSTGKVKEDAIKISIEVAHFGWVKIRVSCVTNDAPYQPHPYKVLDIMDNDDDNGSGVFSCNQLIREQQDVELTLKIHATSAALRNVVLQTRKNMGVDPFGAGYNELITEVHNSVRLAIEVIMLEGLFDEGRSAVIATDVVEVLPRVCVIKQSHASGTSLGGTQIFMFTTQLPRNLSVRFHEECSGWCEDVSPDVVHGSSALWFKSPRYDGPTRHHFVKVKIYLVTLPDSENEQRSDDQILSQPSYFTYILRFPEKRSGTKISTEPKRRRIPTRQKQLHPSLQQESDEEDIVSFVDNLPKDKGDFAYMTAIRAKMELFDQLFQKTISTQAPHSQSQTNQADQTHAQVMPTTPMHSQARPSLEHSVSVQPELTNVHTQPSQLHTLERSTSLQPERTEVYTQTSQPVENLGRISLQPNTTYTSDYQQQTQTHHTQFERSTSLQPTPTDNQAPPETVGRSTSLLLEDENIRRPVPNFLEYRDCSSSMPEHTNLQSQTYLCAESHRIQSLQPENNGTSTACHITLTNRLPQVVCNVHIHGIHESKLTGLVNPTMPCLHATEQTYNETWTEEMNSVTTQNTTQGQSSNSYISPSEMDFDVYMDDEIEDALRAKFSLLEIKNRNPFL